LNSSSKENEVPADSLVQQQIETNNKPIGKSEENEKWAILFLKLIQLRIGIVE
jgi:hypothetical protein